MVRKFKEMSKTKKLRVINNSIKEFNKDFKLDPNFSSGICLLLRDSIVKINNCENFYYRDVSKFLPEINKVKKPSLTKHYNMWWSPTKRGNEARLRALLKIKSLIK